MTSFNRESVWSGHLKTCKSCGRLTTFVWHAGAWTLFFLLDLKKEAQSLGTCLSYLGIARQKMPKKKINRTKAEHRKEKIKQIHHFQFELVSQAHKHFTLAHDIISLCKYKISLFIRKELVQKKPYLISQMYFTCISQFWLGFLKLYRY